MQNRKKRLTLEDTILFLLSISLFEGTFNTYLFPVIDVLQIYRFLISLLFLFLGPIFGIDRSLMLVCSVKKAVAQRGWNPLNMNCDSNHDRPVYHTITSRWWDECKECWLTICIAPWKTHPQNITIRPKSRIITMISDHRTSSSWTLKRFVTSFSLIDLQLIF